MDSNKIDLVVNVDGIPLYKSSSTQIWPIICKFANYPLFIVSLFCGNKKPDDLEKFLHELLHEFDVLREIGFHFLKCVNSHTGYFGCERCTLKGSYELERVIFDDIDSPLRDDESFKQALYLETH